MAGPLPYNSTTHPTVKLGDDWNNLLSQNERSASYIIRKNGSYFEAIKGGTSTGAGTIAFGGSGNAGTVSGTDAAAVINACIAALTSGGVIYLKGPATFTVTASVGTTTVDYITLAGDKTAVLKCAASTNINVVEINNVDGWTIKDFTIDGNKANNTYTGNYFECGGILAGDSAGSGTVTDLTIDGMYIHDTSGDAISVRGTNTKNINITNNHVTDTLRDGIMVSLATTCLISGNTVERCGYIQDISNKWHSIYTYGYDHVISNNIVVDSGGDGIETYGLSDGSITGNIINGAVRNGIYVTIGAIVIANNEIKDAGNDPAQTWKFGIFLNGAVGCTVEGNTIDTTGSVGIYVATASNLNTINGNKITAAGSNSISIYQSDDNTVIGNVINQTTASYGIIVDTADGLSICGNIVKSTAHAGLGYYLSTMTHSIFADNTAISCYDSLTLLSCSANIMHHLKTYDCTLGIKALEASGVAASCKSGDYIPHDMGTTPTTAQLTIGATSLYNCQVYSITATEIVVTIYKISDASEDTSTHPVYWSCQL